MRHCFLVCLFALQALAEPSSISQAAWSEEGKYLLSIGPKRQLRLHDGRTGQIIKTLTVPGDLTTYVSFSPDSGSQEENSLIQLAVSGNRVVTAGRDDALHWWSIPSLEPLATSSSTYGIIGLGIGGDVTAYTCTSSRYLDSEISWKRLNPDGSAGGILPDLPPPNSSASYGAPDVSPDGRWILAPTDERLRLWELRAQEPIAVEFTFPTVFHDYSLAQERFYVLTNVEALGYRYDDPEKEPQHIPCEEAKQIFVTADGTRLFLQSEVGLSVYETTRGTKLQTWNRSGSPLLTLSSDGSRGFTLTQQRLEVWDIPSQTLLYRLK